MQQIEKVLSTMRVDVTIHHNGQYCGNWNIDTSGSQFINFHVISHGSCYLKIGNVDNDKNCNHDIETLNQGDMVIFPADCQHCISDNASFNAPINATQSEGFEKGELPQATGLLCGYFSYNHPIMNTIVQQLPPAIILRQDDQSQKTLIMLINALIVEAKSSGLSDNWMLNKIAESVMALLFLHYLSGSQGILAGMAHAKLQNAMFAILENTQRKWTVDELAQACFMSRTAFASTFNKVLGMTPIEFATHWRLSVAYNQLLVSELSTLQIAINAGYDNESSFSKAFKRVMGVSPGSVKK